MPDQTQSLLTSWLTPVITAVIGFLVAILIERFRNRIVLLKFKRSIFQLGTTTKHRFWGDIEVLYNNRKTNHLSLTTVEIKNDSNIDLENVNVDFWVDENSQMLAYQGNYTENGNSISLEEKYAKEFDEIIKMNESDLKLKNENPNHISSPELIANLQFILGNLKLNLPVFNRNTSIRIQILTENFNGRIPTLSLSILHKACKLVQEEDEAERKMKQDKYVGLIWLVLFGITVTIIYLKYSNRSNAVIWTGLLGIVSLYIAMGIYYLLRQIRRIWK